MKINKKLPDYSFPILFIFILIILFIVSCDNKKEYHGIKYRSNSERITLPLESLNYYGDELPNKNIPCYLIGLQSIGKRTHLEYQFLVKLPDGTLKTFQILSNDNIFLKFNNSNKPQVTITLGRLIYQSLYNYEIVISIPKDGIQYVTNKNIY